MKKIISLCVLILSLGYSAISYADFFESNVLTSDAEIAQIEAINIRTVSFSNNRENWRLESAQRFLNGVKAEALTRIEDGDIPFYRQYDIIQSLSSLAYNMNQYFFYQKLSERTGKAIYKETS